MTNSYDVFITAGWDVFAHKKIDSNSNSYYRTKKKWCWPKN